MPQLSGNSYGHRIVRERHDEYVISWRVDTKGGRLRFSHVQRRDTNRKGALRFAKRWKLAFAFPEEG